MSTISFMKGENWKCGKCNTVITIKYDINTSATDAMMMLLDTHKKHQIDCTAPAAFKLMDTFVKHEEIK